MLREAVCTCCRENEFCVLRYYIGSQFTVSWLPEYFPSHNTLAFILMAVNSLLVIIILTARFAQNLRTTGPLLKQLRRFQSKTLILK